MGALEREQPGQGGDGDHGPERSAHTVFSITSGHPPLLEAECKTAGNI
jgi:hypothetical protein